MPSARHTERFLRLEVERWSIGRLETMSMMSGTIDPTSAPKLLAQTHEGRPMADGHLDQLQSAPDSGESFSKRMAPWMR